jgi:hypothetical protein
MLRVHEAIAGGVVVVGDEAVHAGDAGS